MEANTVYFNKREELLDKLEEVCPIGKFLIEERTHKMQQESNFNAINVTFSKNMLIESKYILGEYNPIIFVKDERIIVRYSINLT